MSESGAPGGHRAPDPGHRGETPPPGPTGPGQADPPGQPGPGEVGDPGRPGGPAAGAQGRPDDHGHPAGPAGPADPAGEHHRLDPWSELIRLADQVAAGRPIGAVVPAWRRRTRGEHRWPVTLCVIAAIVLQILLPDSLTTPLPHWLMPALEGALGVALSVANPVRIERRGPVVHAVAAAQIVLISVANAVSAVLLIRAILEGQHAAGQAGPLLASGASIWVTNVIAFALWYWEFDRGGPVHRAEGTRQYPDFMFPQMTSPGLAPPDWEPYFVDYLYMSFTAATAFSPTDVLPLARWAKLTMAVQSGVSLAIGALVIARAVGILR